MLKTLLERLRRDIDDSKIVSFQFTSKFYVSHLTCYSARLDCLSAENMIPDLLSFLISI